MSLVNAVRGGGNQPKPEVGMEATVCYYSDRNPVEIVEVILFKSGAHIGEVRGVKVRAMDYEIISGSEHDGSAVYEYTRNEKNPVGRTFIRNARGQYISKGVKLSIGSAERYYDPHF